MSIDPKMVLKLREETSAGVMNCKRALEDAGGSYDEAKALIKKRGQEEYERRSHEGLKESRVGVYVHGGGKGAALVELTCDTDFVARNEQFQELLRELALAVYGFNPVAISKDDLSKEMIEEETKKCEALVKGKPPEIAAKIIAGKLEKDVFSKKCLLHIPFPKEDQFKGTYGEFLRSKAAVLKEHITVRRFYRMVAGE